MRHLGIAALALALASEAAYAQTTVTRQISDEPVETVVTQYPGQTVVTRRPLAAAPLAPAARAEGIDVTTTHAALAPRPAQRVVTRTSRKVVARLPQPRVATRVSRVAPASPPLMLSPEQRRVVYTTIVQQSVLPGATALAPAPMAVVRSQSWVPPILQPFTPPIVSGETTEVVTYPPVAYPAAVPASTAPTYAYAYVGTRLPPSVSLLAVPDTAVAQVPSVQPYGFAYVQNRVLLVDPATNLVVADVTE